jgi:hypothetical protein
MSHTNSTIWKFQIPLEEKSEVEMPKDAEVLAVQMQGSQLCVWAAVDPNAEKVKRRFYVVGTGHPMPKSLDACYAATVQIDGAIDTLALHVFHEWDE